MKGEVSDERFRRWISEKPCCVCGGGVYNDESGEWLTDPHHLSARGMGGKGIKAKEVGSVVSLCRRHHTECHTSGLPRFQDRYDVALWHRAKKLGEEWRIKLGREREE